MKLVNVPGLDQDNSSMCVLKADRIMLMMQAARRQSRSVSGLLWPADENSWYFKLHPQTLTAWNYGWACMRRENDRMVWLINWRHEHAKEKSSRLEKCVIFFMDKNESTDLSPNGSLSDGWCLMTDRFPSLRSHVISAEITTHLRCHFHFHCQTAWCYNGNKIRTARYHRSGKCPQEYIHSKYAL